MAVTESRRRNNAANMVSARLTAEYRVWLRSEIDRRRREALAASDGITAADRALFRDLAEKPSRRELDRRRRRGRAA